MTSPITPASGWSGDLLGGRSVASLHLAAGQGAGAHCHSPPPATGHRFRSTARSRACCRRRIRPAPDRFWLCDDADDQSAAASEPGRGDADFLFSPVGVTATPIHRVGQLTRADVDKAAPVGLCTPPGAAFWSTPAVSVVYQRQLCGDWRLVNSWLLDTQVIEDAGDHEVPRSSMLLGSW